MLLLLSNLRKRNAALRRLRKLELKVARSRLSPLSGLDAVEARSLWEKVCPVLFSLGIPFPAEWQAAMLSTCKSSCKRMLISSWHNIARSVSRHGALLSEKALTSIAMAVLHMLGSNPSLSTRFLAPDGGVAVTPDEIVSAVEASWQQIVSKKSLADPERFLSECCVQERPEWEAPPLFGRDIKAQISRAKNNRSVALDGWHVPELKDSPNIFYDIVAQVFTSVESGQSWPQACTEGLVAVIPKRGNQLNVVDVSPANLVLSDGLQTRPITVLSPLFSAYGSLRFRQLAAWRETWLCDSMHGGRSKHEVYDCSWALALNLENSTALGIQLAGVTMDRRKFFDLLDFQIGHRLMEHLGCPKPVVLAARSFYDSLSCRYKVNGACSQPNTRINGFTQGDSYSLQVALAVMCAWTSFIEAGKPPDIDLSL